MAHFALGFGPRADVEVGSPQAAALQVDELGIGASGEAAVLLAGDDLVLRGQGVEVELDHVGSGAHPFEMVAALLVGDDVGAVFQVDAHPRQAFSASPQAPVITRPMMKVLLRKKSSRTVTVALAGLETTPWSAGAVAVLMALPGRAPAATSAT